MKGGFTGIDDFMRDAERVLGYDQLLVDGDTGMRRVAFDLYAGETGMSGVAGDTPVDTGRARSSWMISRGRPDTSVAPDTKGEKMSPGEIRAWNDRALSKLQPDPSMPPIFITNALDYIYPLEFGANGRKPVRMLGRNVARVKAKYAP